MEDTLRLLLDNIFELEGLVTLALKREDSQSEFFRLISKRGMEISEICKKLQETEGLQRIADEALSDKNDTVSSEENEVSEELKDNTSSSDPEDYFSFSEYSIDEGNDNDDDSANLDKIYDNISSSEDSFDEEADNQTEIKEYDTIPQKEKGKLIFSINEKFRFRKELFDNSDIDFNNTLALVASMETYEEAEDYFQNEEGFDPHKPVVIEFMNVIKRYFK